MKKVLIGLEFSQIIAEGRANTSTGSEMLNKYKSRLMAEAESCAMVNQFVREARGYNYDNGVRAVLESVVDYLQANKTSWALATTCESIEATTASRDFLNRNAAKQVVNLLEMSEEDVVKYIRAGALKNVMFCEAFRAIAKQVFTDQPIVEANAEYTAVHPISMVENVGDGLCFEVGGNLYKMDDNRVVTEADWAEVSNTFRTVSRLLESNMVTVAEEVISVKIGENTYNISEENKVEYVRGERKEELTVEGLREHARLVMMTTNPRFRSQIAEALEATALVAENYKYIANMDTVTIYTTKNDKFMVIEAGSNLYAKLLQSRRHPAWSINESAVDALSFIKTKTNVSLSEVYSKAVAESIEQVSEEEREKIEENLKEGRKDDLRNRVAMLTEKFKNDPTKLAVLAQIAEKLGE